MDGEDPNEERGGGHAIAWTVAVVLVMPFVPLMLAGLEYTIFHSTHVENFCRKIGIHEALDKIYNPIFTLLRKLLHR